MTPTGFMNDKDESRCYVNSSFQVLFQNDSSDFEGLLQEMVSKKPFTSRDICYIIGNGQRNI